jgi:hypothetical protein
MNKINALKAVLFGAMLTVLTAVPAFAQTTPQEDVKTDVLAEATPYFTSLVGIVIALFGAALIVTLARKAAGMARGAVKRG